MELRASSSGGASHYGWQWNKLWHVNVPPKVRMHVWRLWKGILPTKLALRKKGVETDLLCPFCGLDEEDAVHIFKNCVVVELLWLGSSVKIRPREHPSQVLGEWLGDMVSSLSGGELEVFCITIWAIWVERNSLVWRDGCFVPTNVSRWICCYLEEYKKEHQRSKAVRKRARVKWRCPPSGRLKMNIDGSYLEHCGSGGCGVVVRNSAGECRAVMASHLPFAQSAFHTEVAALRDGLILARREGWSEVEVETDCEMLVNALLGEIEDLSEVGLFLEECRRYVSSFTTFQIRHIFREANGVAHRLAHLASWGKLDGVWMEETPVIIWDVVFEDLNNGVRDIGLEATPMYSQSININEAIG